LLKAARALFAHIFARAKIHNNTGALPQPPSGEQCSPEPQRAAEYVRAIGAFAKINFHAKVFSLTPLTQYILVPKNEMRSLRRLGDVLVVGGDKKKLF
jgi:hypothetical protein